MKKAFVLLALLGAGCAGEYTGTCYSNNTCDPGYVCLRYVKGWDPKCIAPADLQVAVEGAWAPVHLPDGSGEYRSVK